MMFFFYGYPRSLQAARQQHARFIIVSAILRILFFLQAATSSTKVTIFLVTAYFAEYYLLIAVGVYPIAMTVRFHVRIFYRFYRPLYPAYSYRHSSPITVSINPSNRSHSQGDVYNRYWYSDYGTTHHGIHTWRDKYLKGRSGDNVEDVSSGYSTFTVTWVLWSLLSLPPTTENFVQADVTQTTMVNTTTPVVVAQPYPAQQQPYPVQPYPAQRM